MSCNTDDINESILLQRLADGDRDVFRALYDRYRDKLFYYTLRLTASKQVAEDVLQDVFIKVWRNRDKMQDIRSFDAWLFTLAKNQIINGFRRASMEQAILTEIKESTYRGTDAITQIIDYKEINRFLQNAIAQLPPQQKVIYRLRREQGLKNTEIAERLNISPLTVKKHISQASRTLRQFFREQTGVTISMLLALVKNFL